jgi:hypothetical protein
MTDHASEINIQKFDDDLLIFKHLLGESFISSDILCCGNNSMLTMECLDFTIKIQFIYHSTPYSVNAVRIFKKNEYGICVCNQPYLSKFSVSWIFHNVDNVWDQDCTSKNELIDVLENSFMNINKDIIQKYISIIMCCFNLMGG